MIHLEKIYDEATLPIEQFTEDLLIQIYRDDNRLELYSVPEKKVLKSIDATRVKVVNGSAFAFNDSSDKAFILDEDFEKKWEFKGSELGESGIFLYPIDSQKFINCPGVFVDISAKTIEQKWPDFFLNDEGYTRQLRHFNNINSVLIEEYKNYCVTRVAIIDLENEKILNEFTSESRLGHLASSDDYFAIEGVNNNIKIYNWDGLLLRTCDLSSLSTRGIQRPHFVDNHLICSLMSDEGTAFLELKISINSDELSYKSFPCKKYYHCNLEYSGGKRLICMTSNYDKVSFHEVDEDLNEISSLSLGKVDTKDIEPNKAREGEFLFYKQIRDNKPGELYRLSMDGVKDSGKAKIKKEVAVESVIETNSHSPDFSFIAGDEIKYSEDNIFVSEALSSALPEIEAYVYGMDLRPNQGIMRFVQDAEVSCKFDDYEAEGFHERIALYIEEHGSSAKTVLTQFKKIRAALNKGVKAGTLELASEIMEDIHQIIYTLEDNVEGNVLLMWD